MTPQNQTWTQKGIYVKRTTLINLIVPVSLSLLVGCGTPADSTSTLNNDDDGYAGSTFEDIWNQVTSDVYQTLPQKSVTLGSFGWFQSRLRSDAKRTLNSRKDILPRFKKLLHPNGICLAGKWSIDQSTPFTGYFAQGSEALIVARASVALSETTQGNFRGFGLAGKLIPTSVRNHTDKLKTANFFTVDDLGGTKTANFTDALLLNRPKLSTSGRGTYVKAIGAAVGLLFNLMDSNPNERQLYEISELGLANPAKAVTPRFMRLVGDKTNVKIASQADFRNELMLKNYEGNLKFSIELSSDGKAWKRVGTMEFTDDAASDSCDHRLHFHHPKNRSDLTFGQI
jgi:hypothetical protein